MATKKNISYFNAVCEKSNGERVYCGVSLEGTRYYVEVNGNKYPAYDLYGNDPKKAIEAYSDFHLKVISIFPIY